MKDRMVMAAVLALAASCGGSSTERGDGGGNGGIGQEAGAGTDAGAASCVQAAPCGGDATGTWTITQNCVVFSEDLASVCTGLTASGTLTFAGSATYRTDRTYTQTATLGGTFQYDYPATCLQGRSCAQLQPVLMAAGSSMGAFDSVACRANNGGCLCDARLLDSPDDETGTYAVSGTTLATTHDGTTDATPFCVSGSVMRQFFDATDPGPPAVTGSGYIALTRQ